MILTQISKLIKTELYIRAAYYDVGNWLGRAVSNINPGGGTVVRLLNQFTLGIRLVKKPSKMPN